MASKAAAFSVPQALSPKTACATIACAKLVVREVVVISRRRRTRLACDVSGQ